MKMKFQYIFSIVAVLLCVSCAHRRGAGYVSSKRSSAREETYTSTSLRGKLPDNTTSNNKILSSTEIFSRCNTAVFLVVNTDGEMVAQGSGFFINDEGLAVSNYHVFEGMSVGAEMIKIPGSNKIYKVTDVYARNKERDFIIFRVNIKGNNYLPIAESKPQVGEHVYAIGSPKGLENTFSSGEISQWRSDDIMQINVPIDHGSSGGALINGYGEVVGITSGTFDENSSANLNYAMSIEQIKKLLK